MNWLAAQGSFEERRHCRPVKGIKSIGKDQVHLAGMHLGKEAGQEGGQGARITVNGQVVGPQGIHDDQDDIVDAGGLGPHVFLEMPVLLDGQDPFGRHGEELPVPFEKIDDGVITEVTEFSEGRIGGPQGRQEKNPDQDRDPGDR